MKNMKQKLATTLIAVSAVAWGKGTFELKNSAFVEKLVVEKDGSKSKKLVPAGKVVPGDEVTYVISYKNLSDKPAADVIISNKIPLHMIYSQAEANEKSALQFSVDAGKTFGPLEKLKVNDNLRKRRSALPADVTNVQWKFAKFVQPKEEGEVKFRAVLR
jgi:uncharacterized repeat protein (TIGR01451 family)